jgi:hypothetical protein
MGLQFACVPQFRIRFTLTRFTLTRFVLTRFVLTRFTSRWLPVRSRLARFGRKPIALDAATCPTPDGVVQIWVWRAVFFMTIGWDLTKQQNSYYRCNIVSCRCQDLTRISSDRVVTKLVTELVTDLVTEFELRSCRQQYICTIKWSEKHSEKHLPRSVFLILGFKRRS